MFFCLLSILRIVALSEFGHSALPVVFVGRSQLCGRPNRRVVR
jgi:hypothetical protein